jgi:RNA polymerase sigma factor for flagellar operon FliA
MRRVEAAIRALEQRLGRSPKDTEVADSIEMSLVDYQRTLRDARASQMVHFEDFSEEGEADFFEKHLGDVKADPLHQLIDQHDCLALGKALASLPERERLLMRLYYEEDLNLREIGVMFGVSESRVCQLHKQAVSRLKQYLLDPKAQAQAAKAEGSSTRARTRRAAPAISRPDSNNRVPAHACAGLRPVCQHASNQAVFHAVVG